MGISILYSNKDKIPAVRYPERMFCHLCIDKITAYLCADTTKRNLFSDILSFPLFSECDIEYRQNVLRDLYNDQDTANKLCSLFEQFGELYNWQKEAKKEKYSIKASKSMSLSSAKNMLQVSALTLKRALLFVREMHQVLSSEDISAEGLLKLKSALAEHLSDPEFSEMLDLCSSFEYFKTSGSLDIKLSVSKEGKLEKPELIEHKYIRITDPELKKKGLSKLFSKDEPQYTCSRVYARPSDRIEDILSEAVCRTAEVFTKSADTLFNRYLSIAKELTFYRIAIQYIKMLCDKSIHFSYPKMSEKSKATDVKDLYDLSLIVSKPNPRSILPNSMNIKENSAGIMLFGDNGSGKTVFLRSVAIMHVLAQAGLPIPAEHAVLPIYTRLVTQFSEGEKEFTEGNDAGRFEQEVRELAYMVDELPPHSLVFLNETFQTTAYDEGAEGLYHILNFFKAKSIRFISVTHLRQLEDKFSYTELTRLYTSDGYKVQAHDIE